LLLIEEPEAHLHPQLQIRLMEFLQQKTVQQSEIRPVQVIVTSHSPNLASKAGLENVILVHSGKTFPLGPSYTRLNQSDYKFLQRFLDVTKANLFFARGVVIVEGDAEQILLPTIAKLIGFPFAKYGVSIVNVGSVGLFRYARIFQRQDGADIGIRVACLTDMDIPPDEARAYLHITNERRRSFSDFTPEQIVQQRSGKENRTSGIPVQTYVSPHWTLEYDLCNHNLRIALLVHQAVKLAEASKDQSNGISLEQMEQIKINAVDEFHQWQANNLSSIQIATNIYESLFRKRASKPETAQFLAKLLEDNLADEQSANLRAMFPDYIISAINYVTRQP
ncbi:MAG: AAA family ATPase, partial [Bacteroidetes bacterium]|nr:AAA family ATPase [Bacteroidota bacterium]